MTRFGFLLGAAVLAVVSWLCLPVVALVMIVRDKLERLAHA